MSTDPGLQNRIHAFRAALMWSQQELADRTGIARASVSAIENGRLAPSTTAALSLAAALGCRVEDLFQLSGDKPASPQWAWPAHASQGRYFSAEVGGRTLLYPYEANPLGACGHDGIIVDGVLTPRVDAVPPTLVVACCDPAVGLLVRELAVVGIRMLVFLRSSRQALKLLKDGVVHVAGIHLSSADEDGNVEAAMRELQGEYRLLRVAQWEEGVATRASNKSSIRSLVKSRTSWIGREPGSGARQCLDDLLGKQRAPRRIARDHRGVADAVRDGWADAGVCLRLAAEESGLRFLKVRDEAYDLCFADADDFRLRRLGEIIGSQSYKSLLNDLPGYRARTTGSETRVKCGTRP